MPKDYLAEPNAKVRRSDREKDESWIREYLHKTAIGNLATLHDGQPFINSNLFVFDEKKHAIYMHTARVGRTRANVEKEEKVCFSVSDLGRLLPADVALEFSCEYSGVVVFGSGQIISDYEEAKKALQLMLDKYFPNHKPGRDYRAITVEELDRTSVFKISIKDWSGKKKEVEADFPGAFNYQAAA